METFHMPFVERLEHANVGITLDIYSHTDLEVQKDTVAKLEQILI